MIIDGHQHVLKDVKEQIRINKHSNIDRVVLFSTSVHPETAKNKEEFSNELNTLNKILRGEINPIEARINSIKELAAAIKVAPDYFVGFGSCPFGLDLNQTIDWIEKYIVGNNLKGIGELVIASGSVQALENIFKFAHEMDKSYPIWLHTFNPLQINDLKDIVELANRYSRVKVILGHSGGSNWLDLIDMVKDKKNLFMDISASFTTYSIKYISESLPDRCVYSSDLPYGDPYLCINQINHIIKDEIIRQKVLGENTRILLEL
jgi:uncharacterized protein